MKQIVGITLLCILLLACSTTFQNASPKEFAEHIKQEQTLLLDVRTKGEYEEIHIEDATLIPVQELSKRIDEISSYKSNTILVYCRSGRRSVSAAKILHKEGFSTVINLKSGIVGWKKAGYPVK